MPRVVGDLGLLSQLFQNLLGNALKFVPPGRRPEIHVTATREAEGWVLGVADNGVGIDPAHAARIFEPFQRLHTSTEYAGTGIGLSICRRIVERHEGTLWVEPAPGAGSVFRFTLPV